MFKGSCAECGAHWNSKRFKSRPAGYEIPPPHERILDFMYENDSNNKICAGCYMKNKRLLDARKNERLNDRENVIEQAEMQNEPKRVRLHQTVNNSKESFIDKMSKGEAALALCLLSDIIC